MPQQRYRLLQALRDAGRDGLSSWDIAHEMCILRAGARLKELRSEGYSIQTVQQPNGPNGQRRFRYVLKAEPEAMLARRESPAAVTPGVEMRPSPSRERNSSRPASTDKLFDAPPPRRSAITGGDIKGAA